MKILHIIPTLEGGGAERQLVLLAVEQFKRGWLVHVVCRRGGIYEDALRNGGVVVHLLGDYKGISPMLLVSINTLIKKIKPDVVQTWLTQMDIIGGIASLWNSVPWIASERASSLAYQHFNFQVWARNSLVRYAKAVVANSSNGVKYWRKILPISARVFQVANVVDVAAIRNATPASIEISNFSDNMKYFLIVGRLSPEKSIETIIQAIRLVPVKHNIHILIIGEGPLRGEIEASISQNGLNERISLLPYRADWWGLLKNACALISMSRFEGHPNVVLETMAARCPLIASDIPAYREFLDEDTAIMVTLDNPAMLAEAIISLLSDPVSAHQRAERSSIYVAGLTIRLAADAYEIIYKKVISEKGK